jgi:manganese-dependent inorganic pyrophosphatase
VDIETADYLSSITGLDIKTLGQDLQTAANQINSLSAEELVVLDMKEYNEQGTSFTVSQVETDNPAVMVERRDEIITALKKMRSSKGTYFSALLVTDVTVLDSILFVTGEKSFISHINLPAVGDSIYELREVVSRKKQLVPLLAEVLAKYKG